MPSISRLFGVGDPKSVVGSITSGELSADVYGTGAADVNCGDVAALVAEFKLASVVSEGGRVELIGAISVDNCDG